MSRKIPKVVSISNIRSFKEIDEKVNTKLIEMQTSIKGFKFLGVSITPMPYYDSDPYNQHLEYDYFGATISYEMDEED